MLVSFGEKNLSHYGGIFLIHSFCKRLKLKWRLQKYVRFFQRNQEYQTAEFILVIIYIIILGIRRIEKIRSLQTNGVFKKTIGMKKIPDPSAIRRFLYRLTPKAIYQIVQVHDLIQRKIFYILHTKTSITFDIDAKVITVYGKRIQRAKVGYNPKRKGARSYLGFFCFESDREFWYASLRSGNVSQVKVAKHFLKRCLAKLPYPIYRIRVRLDAAFYSGELIEDYLEEENIIYTIEAQITSPMLGKMQSIKYHQFEGRLEIGEFPHRPTRWRKGKKYRYIVIKRLLPKDPEEKAQLKLFEIKGYGYRVLITNLKLKPENVWKFHSQRAQGSENNIKELTKNYSLVNIPTHSYTANIAYFQMLLFAFNIINWFKWLCLPEKYHYVTLQTIRDQLLVTPARLTKTANKNELKFPFGYPYENLFNYAKRKTERMKQL